MSTGLPPGEQEQNSHKIIGGAPLELENSYREGRPPDCLVSHAGVPGSKPVDPTWVIQINIIVSFSLNVTRQ